MNLTENTIETAIDALKQRLNEIIVKDGISSQSALCVSQRLDCIIAQRQRYLLKKK